LATQQEVANLRATIQQLEDTVSTLEARAAAAKTAPSP
jgi:BMFP domain-containing protein YqiC